MTHELDLDGFLTEPAPPVSVTAAEEIAKTVFGVVGTATPLSGERDSNFRLDREDGHPLLLRVIHPAEPPEEVDLQGSLLLYLERSAPQLPLPKVVWPRSRVAPHAVWLQEGAVPRRVRMYTYLAGRPATNIDNLARFRYEVGELAGHLDRALVDFEHPYDARSISWDLRRLGAICPKGSRPPEVAALVERYESAIKPSVDRLPTQVIHNDLNPHNILLGSHEGGGIVGLIDFGDMVRGPRVQEVATACAYQIDAAGDPLRGAIQLARGYHAVSPLWPGELRLVPELIAMRLALALTINRWAADRHPRNAEYLLRNVTRTAAGFEALCALELDRAGESFARAVMASTDRES